MVEADTEAGEEVIVAVGRTMTSMSLKPTTSSQGRAGRTQRFVLVVQADGKINMPRDVPHRAAPKRGLAAYNEACHDCVPGIGTCQPGRSTSRAVREMKAGGSGRDEALSAKDLLYPVRGVALAPVLEALWICTDGGNRQLLFDLHNLIPTRQQGLCSPIRPSTKASQLAPLPVCCTRGNENERRNGHVSEQFGTKE